MTDWLQQRGVNAGRRPTSTSPMAIAACRRARTHAGSVKVLHHGPSRWRWRAKAKFDPFKIERERATPAGCPLRAARSATTPASSARPRLSPAQRRSAKRLPGLRIGLRVRAASKMPAQSPGQRRHNRQLKHHSHHVHRQRLPRFFPTTEVRVQVATFMARRRRSRIIHRISERSPCGRRFRLRKIWRRNAVTRRASALAMPTEQPAAPMAEPEIAIIKLS